MSFLEEAWEEREEKLYKELFGGTGKGIYPLTAELFTNNFGAESIDPRWLHYGVFSCPPTEERNTWVYVSSGMSNPWESDKKEDFSGLGIELLSESEAESAWGIQLLQNLTAYNILLSVGKFGEQPMLDYGHRIPTKIAPNLSHVVLSSPLSFPKSIELKSGKVDLIQVIGVTPQELEFAKNSSTSELVQLISNKQGSLVTIPERSSYVNA